MNPLLIAVPVLGAGALFLLWPKKAAAAGPSPYTPQPSPAGVGPAFMSGGVRYMTYIQRIDAAAFTWRAVKLIGGTAASSALAELRGTLDVVKGMAFADQARGQLTAQDMAAINAKIDALNKEIGGSSGGGIPGIVTSL